MNRRIRIQAGRILLLLLTGILLFLLTGMPPRALILVVTRVHGTVFSLFLLSCQALLILCAYLFFLSLCLVEGYRFSLLILQAKRRAWMPLPPPPLATPPLPETETLPLSLLFPNPYEEYRGNEEEASQTGPLPIGKTSEKAAETLQMPHSEEINGQKQLEHLQPPHPQEILLDDPLSQPQNTLSKESPSTLEYTTSNENLLLSGKEVSSPSLLQEERNLPLVKKTPLERLETFYEQQMQAGTSLERLTVDFVREQTHVKRETVGAFLRQKKAEAVKTTQQRSSSPKMEVPEGAPQLDNRTLQSAEISHPGIKRAQDPNEDSMLAIIVGERGLFAVADGMGGQGYGQEASQQIVAHLREHFIPFLAEASENACRDQLAKCVKEANTLLFQRNQQTHRTMGTTLTAAVLVQTRAYIVNIGDSRTYWQSNTHGLVRVSKDHSTVEKMIDQHLITPQQRYTHPKRNEIFRCLGQQEHIELDAFFVPLESGDRLLLCSDGLWGMVPQEEHLARLLAQEKSLWLICEELRDAALTGGGEDNITAVIVQAMKTASH